MIGLDTNILIPLLVSSDSNHKNVTSWLGTLDEVVVTTHTNFAECLRLLTHPRVFMKPLTLSKAVEHVESLLEEHEALLLEDSLTWPEELRILSKQLPGIRGNQVFDARIALCLKANGAKRIATFDSDFAKYSFLKMIHP